MGLGGVSIFEIKIAMFFMYSISFFLVVLSHRVSGAEKLKWSVIVLLIPVIGFVLFRRSEKKRS
jgi:hypothetical protein